MPEEYKCSLTMAYIIIATIILQLLGFTSLIFCSPLHIGPLVVKASPIWFVWYYFNIFMAGVPIALANRYFRTKGQKHYLHYPLGAILTLSYILCLSPFVTIILMFVKGPDIIQRFCSFELAVRHCEASPA